ncbi:MAG: cyclic nucleotide-binding domain-containing protein [Magnetococcales bacterium]|nr:cyclic nucleotide-binding domain-containing protein [Magnetococcales bacterium]
MLILKLLEQIPFFWEFTEEERQIFVDSNSFFIHYQPNDLLIREGDEDDALLIILEGSALVHTNANPEVTLATLTSSAIIGELSFLTKQPRTSNVVAQQETVAFRIDGQAMKQLDPVLQLKIKDQLIRILVDRLEQMNHAMAKQKEMNQVLARALAEFGAEQGEGATS